MLAFIGYCFEKTDFLQFEKWRDLEMLKLYCKPMFSQNA